MRVETGIRARASAIALAALVGPGCFVLESLGLPPVTSPPGLIASAPLPQPPLLDVLGHRGVTVYWVLGFVDEYLGRSIVDGHDLVIRLYCNEQDKAPTVRAMLHRLLREQRLPDDLDESAEQCLLAFRSPELARAIDSLYTRRQALGSFARMGAARGEVVDLFVTADMFDLVGRDAKLAYLAGAFYRHQREGAFLFANAAHKADLVADLLRGMGAGRVERETLPGRPNGNFVRFTPTPELTAWLGRAGAP